MHEDRFAFNRGAVRPLECLSGAWRLIKQDYWLFLGISFVGVLIGGVASPILVGPATCGIHICLLRAAHGQRVTFDMLFQGFNYFVASLIATLVMLLPMIALILMSYFGLIGGAVGVVFWAAEQEKAGAPPDAAAFGMLSLLLAVFVLFAFAIDVFFKTFFFFIYPLIVDRELTGMEAVRLSFRAALGNLGGVVGVVLLDVLLETIGVSLCLVGFYLFLPLQFAMTTIAYQQVFPPRDPHADLPFDPEPPAPVVLVDATAVQVKEPRVTSVQEPPPGPAPR